MKETFYDFILTILVIIILLPFLYWMGNFEYGLFASIIMLAILIPTIYSLVNGAPFVPTPINAVEIMLKEANIKKGEKLYDIGCGDGRTVYLAAKNYGANAVGLEISPIVYFIARIRHFFWKSKAKILFRDFKRYNLGDADIVLCYLLPDTLARLQEKLDNNLRKGTRVISYAFPIGNWKAEKVIENNPTIRTSSIWIYKKR